MGEVILGFINLFKQIASYITWLQRDSNPWPLWCRYNALPTELWLATWPMNESEAGVDLILIRNLTAFLMWILTNKHENNIINNRKGGGRCVS